MPLISGSRIQSNFTDIGFPLVRNAFRQNGDAGGALASLSAGGSVTISAVHTYKYGFESPYAPDQASANAYAATLADATQSTPYWYGRYNMGPRFRRGGLNGGWGGTGGGNLLRIQKPAEPAGENSRYFDACYMNLPFNMKHNQYRARFWVWSDAGLRFRMGYSDSAGTVTIPSTGTWHYIDTRITMSQITSGGLAISFNYVNEAVDMYFGVIQITIPNDGSGDAQAINIPSNSYMWQTGP